VQIYERLAHTVYKYLNGINIHYIDTRKECTLNIPIYERLFNTVYKYMKGVHIHYTDIRRMCT